MEEPQKYMTANLDGVPYEAINFYSSASSSTPRPSSFTFSSETFDPSSPEQTMSVGFTMYQLRAQDGTYITDSQTNFPEISNCTSSDLGMLCGQLSVFFGESRDSLFSEYSSQLSSGTPETPFQINFIEIDIRYDGVVSGTFSGELSNRQDESDKLQVTEGKFRVLLDD